MQLPPRDTVCTVSMVPHNNHKAALHPSWMLHMWFPREPTILVGCGDLQGGCSPWGCLVDVQSWGGFVNSRLSLSRGSQPFYGCRLARVVQKFHGPVKPVDRGEGPVSGPCARWDLEKGRGLKIYSLFLEINQPLQ